MTYKLCSFFFFLSQTEMATKSPLIPLLLPEDELLCSICQTLLSNPVTTPCGHNFCMSCISKHWRFSMSAYCPHCRTKFPSKPDLKTNTILSAIMEHVEKVWPEFADVSIPSEEMVSCDICEEGRKLSAVKTCVTCLASFCNVHATPHMNSQVLAKHCLCSPVSDITDLLCTKHNKLLEVFCLNHGAAICWQCTAKHRKCNTRSVEVMRTDWKVSWNNRSISVSGVDKQNCLELGLITRFLGAWLSRREIKTKWALHERSAFNMNMFVCNAFTKSLVIRVV